MGAGRASSGALKELASVHAFWIPAFAGKTEAALPIFNNGAASHLVSIPLGSPSPF